MLILYCNPELKNIMFSVINVIATFPIKYRLSDEVFIKKKIRTYAGVVLCFYDLLIKFYTIILLPRINPLISYIPAIKTIFRNGY